MVLDAVCEAYPRYTPTERMGGDGLGLLALSFDAGVRTVAQKYHKEQIDAGETRTKEQRVAEAAQGLTGMLEMMPPDHPEALRLKSLLASR